MFRLKRVANRGVIGVALTALLAGAVWSGGRSATPVLANGVSAPAAAITVQRSTAFQIVNRGAVAANVQAQFFDATGAQIAYSPTPSGGTLAPGAGWTLDQQFDANMGSTFAGGAIILADQPLAGLVNEKLTSGLAYDSYVGIGNTETATTIICPVALKNAFNAGAVYNTIVNVQGAGAAQGSVTATLRDLNGVVAATSAAFNLNPGATKPLDLSDSTTIPGAPAIPSPFFGSVTLVGTQPLAAAVEQLTTTGAPQLIDYTCFGSASASTTVYAPLVFNLSDQRTAVWVANFGAVTANVTLQFYNGAGTALAPILDTIAPSAAKNYDQLNQPAGYVFGSLTITSNQPVAAIVEEVRSDNAYGSSYRGIPDTALSSGAILPLVLSDIVNGSLHFSTAFQVYNPGVTSATLNIVFTPNGGGAAINIPATVPAGKSVTFDQRHGKCLLGLNITAASCTQNVGGVMDFLPANSFGSIKINVTAGPPVAVIVNEIGGTNSAADYGPALGDTLLSYNGFP